MKVRSNIILIQTELICYFIKPTHTQMTQHLAIRIFYNDKNMTDMSHRLPIPNLYAFYTKFRS